MEPLNNEMIMKRYIKPALEIFAVKTQSMMTESNIKIEKGNEEINGSVGAKGTYDFEDEDEDY